MSCINKNSKEWKYLVALHGEVRAEEIWNTTDALINDPTLNEENLVLDDSEFAENVTEDVLVEGTPLDFTKAFEKVLVSIKEQQSALSNKIVKNQEAKEFALRRLYKEIKELEGVEAINLFVNDAYERAELEVKNFKALMDLKKQGTLSNHELLEKLVEIHDFVNNYSILDEISKVEVIEYFTEPITHKDLKDYTPQDKIKRAIQIRDQIRLAFTTEAIPIMAETLVGYRRGSGNVTIADQIIAINKRIAERIEQGKSIVFLTGELKSWQNMLIDKDKMIGILNEALKDESTFDYLVNPLISSTDSALALFAKMVKSKMEYARIDDISARDIAVDATTKYMKDSGNSTNNVVTRNKDIYEVVPILVKNSFGRNEKDADGKLVFKDKMSFVQKFDQKEYAKQENIWYGNNLKPKLTENASEYETEAHEKELADWYILRRNWYAGNTQPKSREEINKIQAEKQAQLDAEIITEEEYQDWVKSVIFTHNGKKIFMKELAQPHSRYLNPKWQLLYNKDGVPISPAGEYHKFLTDMYLKDQEMIPVGQRMGLILPAIPMEEWERIQRLGFIEASKRKIVEAVKRKEYDEVIYGNQLTNEGSAPIYFTFDMDANDVSVDLLSSVLKYGQMARNFNALNSIHAEITAFKNIIGHRKAPVKDAAGNSILNKMADKLGFEIAITKAGQTNSELHLNAFIEMVIQGESQKSEILFGKDISKIANSLMGIASITTISMDVLKGMANNLQGNIQIIIEAAGGEYFNYKNLAKGGVKYWTTLGGALSDFGKAKPESWLGRLTEYYDAIQGTFKDQYGKNVSASMANKLFRTNTLFFNMHFAEHEIQVKTLLAMMDATKVIDKESGKTITLLEAHEKYGPRLSSIKKDSAGKEYTEYKVQIKIINIDNTEEIKDFDERERQDFMNTVHGINKKLHGVYNNFDKGTAQRHSLGRLLMMYRKHMVPAFKRRYQGAYYDEEIGLPQEGMYRVFWRTMLKDIVTYKLNIASRWTTYTPFEKARIRKVTAELSIVIGLITLISILVAMAGDDDDEKKEMPYMYHFMLYQALRMRSETMAYISPADTYRILKSPSAVMGPLDRAMRFIDQFIFTWDEKKLVYQRDTGIWKKGDNKSWAYFLRVMGFSGYNFTPKAAHESFRSTWAK